MTGKERVIKTLKFRSTVRVPRDLWWQDAVELEQESELKDVLETFPPDITQPTVVPQETPVQRKSPHSPQFNYGKTELLTKGKYIDDWGCVRYVAEDGVTGEVKKPILKDITNLEKIDPPWEFLDSLDISNINNQCKKTDKFVLSGVCARPFERMQFLRGSENLYKDIIRNREEFLELLNLVHEYNLEHIKKWLKTDVDGIFIMDDWGQQNNLLISPQMWREIFKPIYRQYAELTHEADKYLFFHSDGWIEELYEDFIEVGVDAINSQLFAMNIEKIARDFGGKITFWGEIDRQNILHFGDPLDVEQAVLRVKKAFQGQTGGLIVQCEWGKDNPKENIEAVFKAWQTPIEVLKSKFEPYR